MARGDWRRVSRRRPCPVCEKPDWCLYAGDESAPTAAICARVESDKRVGTDGAGWLHVLRNDGPTWPGWKRTVHIAARQLQPAAPASAEAIAREAEAAVAATSPETLRCFAAGLGLTADSLGRLGVGYMKTRRAWGFPMKDGGGRIVGVRLRYAKGKAAIRGGREGLFIPEGLHAGGRLLIAEGPTDTAALLDLGFNAVGRPSCTGGVKHLVELAKRLKPVEVAIIADADQVGRRGASSLASTLLAYVPIVRVVLPPDGVKDARAWKQAGATRADVNTLIEGAKPRTLKIACRAVGIRSQGNRLRERTLPKA